MALPTVKRWDSASGSYGDYVMGQGFARDRTNEQVPGATTAPRQVQPPAQTGFQVPQNFLKSASFEGMRPDALKPGTDWTSYQQNVNPQEDWIMKLYQQQLGGGSGAGGGGGAAGAGAGAAVQAPFTISREGVAYSPELQAAMKNMLDPEQNPFGQAAINLRNKQQTEALQASEAKINADFAARGQSGSPQHQAALRGVRQQYGSQVDATIQQMTEARASFSLDSMTRVGQLEGALAQLHTQINIAEGETRAQLKMHEMSMRASMASARASLKLGIIDRMAQRDNELYERHSKSRENDRNMYLWGQSRAMDFQQFRRQMYEDDRNFNYTERFNQQMMDIQTKANKNSIWKTIGGLVGGIGGLVLPGMLGGGTSAANTGTEMPVGGFGGAIGGSPYGNYA